MKKRTIIVHGFLVHLYDFGYGKYLYPDFNGDAEFDVTRIGFKKLSTYLKIIKSHSLKTERR